MGKTFFKQLLTYFTVILVMTSRIGVLGMTNKISSTAVVTKSSMPSWYN